MVIETAYKLTFIIESYEKITKFLKYNIEETTFLFTFWKNQTAQLIFKEIKWRTWV